MVTSAGAALVTGAVVRVWNGDEVVGGGFLVGPDLVATCAHVVADALGGDPYSPVAPDAPVRLDFPLVTSGADRSGHVDAVVQQWFPIADDGGADMALLRLTASPPEARVPPLRRIDRLWDHGFTVLGFPDGRPEGVWSSGLIRGEQGTRWFQLQSTPGEQSIEGGFSGSAVWEEQSGAVVGMTVAADRGDTTTAYLIPIDQVVALDPALMPSPYRGLQPFEEEHAATFFGRDAEIDKLLDAVGRTRVVAVAGPSGAGKSSLVRAGLLPRLRAAGTPVVDVRAVPGADLTAELDSAHTPGSVLVVDQFEELAAVDPPGARRVLEQLVRLTDAEPVHAVLTVRWAALDQVVTPELMGVLENGTVLVAPLSRARLREAIVGPAERSPGLVFEPGLVDRILDDAGAEPGQLPLVESLLTDLWDRRDGGHLTLHAYEAAGGVAGAVAAHAERAIDALRRNGPDTVETVRRLFIALARPDRDGRLVRQAVPLTQLPAAQRALVPALADGRLLVVGPSRSGGAAVEPAHQALIDHWPRLRGWLEADRAFLDWRDRVDGRRERWESEGHAHTALLRGATLAEAEDWLPARSHDISPASTDYLHRSKVRQRWEVRRWRIVTTVLAVLGLVAATLAVTAIDRRQVLAGQLATATAGALARESQDRAPTDVVLGAQLALAAWRADPEHPQARASLAASFAALSSADAELANVGPEAITGLQAAGDTAIAVGPPRPVAVTGVAGAEPSRQELPDTGRGHQLAVGPDGRLLADVPPDGSAVRLRELAAPAQLRTLSAPGVRVGVARFSPDGTRLTWLQVDSANAITMTVWDLRTDAAVPHGLGALPPDTLRAWPTPDPELVLVQSGQENATTRETRLSLRSLVDGAEVAVMPSESVVALGGAAVVSCADDGTGVRMMAVDMIGAATPLPTLHTTKSVCEHWISADGGFLIERLGLGGPDQDRARIIDLRTGTARELHLPAGVIDRPRRLAVAPTVAVVRAPDGPTVLTAHGSSVLRHTTRPVFADLAIARGSTGRFSSDDGRYVVSVVGDALVVEDTSTGRHVTTLQGAVGDDAVVGVGTEIGVLSPDGSAWTLSRYEIPTLHRVASFPLPVSANPAPARSVPGAGQNTAVNEVEAPDGRRLLSLSDGMLAVLDPQTGRPVSPPTTLGASPEERRWFQRATPLLMPRPGHPGHAIVAGMDGGLQVWDAMRGERLQTIPTSYRPADDGRLPRIAIDRAGRRVAVLTPYETVEVWDVDNAALLGPAIPAPGVSELDGFDADGYLVGHGHSISAGSEIRFLDIEEGRGAGSVTVQGWIAGVTDDGRSIWKLDSDGHVPERVPVTAMAWRDELCVVLDRPLTETERAALPPGASTDPPCS